MGEGRLVSPVFPAEPPLKKCRSHLSSSTAVQLRYPFCDRLLFHSRCSPFYHNAGEDYRCQVLFSLLSLPLPFFLCTVAK